MHYEELVNSPKNELQSICDFLGEGYEPQMARPQQLAQTNIEPESFHAPLLNPPTKKQVGRWQREMEPADLRLFQNIAGELLQELGYPLAETNAQSFDDKLRQFYLAIKYDILQSGRYLATALRLMPPI